MGFGVFKKLKDRMKTIKPWIAKVIPKVTEVIKKATPVVKNLLDETQSSSLWQTPDFNGKNKVREVLDVANNGANLVDNIISKRKANSKITPTLIDWTKQNLVPKLKQKPLLQINDEFDDTSDE